MGFNSVYQTLKELFPQVDARILKAVAIEHSKDADGAVETILTDVLPFVNDHSHGPRSDVKNNGKAVEMSSQSSAMLRSIAGDNAAASDPLNIGNNINSLSLNETLDDSLVSSFYDARDSDGHPNGNSKNEDLIALASCAETSTEATRGVYDSLIVENGKDVCNQLSENHENDGCFPSHQYQDAGANLLVNETDAALSCSADVKDDEADVSLSNVWTLDPDCLNVLPSHDLHTTPSFDCHKEQPFLDCNSLEYQDAAEETLVLIKDHMLDALDSNLREPENYMYLSHNENQESSSYVDAEFIQESTVTDPVGTEDQTDLSTIVTHSGHICRIDLLEDLIENAKGHKVTLFSTIESVVALIKEVEVQEKAAQQAKEDAARGGLKILEKVEEIKNMLKHAKEANDMHAGGVYGEKSILATEVKELQTRLLGLSDEKEKSLSILDEMRKTLEARLTVAEQQMRKAEQEIFDKEESARSALSEQELIMEKVVQESKLLEQEAEENAKLREFLMEKGRIVDILQGEISVICQDVRLLKENFDDHVTTGKSTLFRQTSSHLASSSSSVKTVASDPGPGTLKLLESPTKTSRTPSVGSQTPQSCVGKEQVVKTGATPRKELLDEDWELFDFLV